VNDEVEQLRARVEELERRVEVLFRHTGTPDWERDALAAPPVSEEVRALLAAGEERKAAKRYEEETGAGIGETAAALGEVAKELRGGQPG
jgi:predicted NUDIX family NTP pyrophosphohydrolase